MENKKLIAVLPLWDEDKQSLWMLPNYFKAIQAAGGIPIMLPFTNSLEDIKKLAISFDGFLFPGGQDIDPALYNEERTSLTQEVCSKRDNLESLLLKQVLGLNKPILGICRGFQFINASLGGKLYQDLKQEFGNKVNHEQSKPYDSFAHTVKIDGFLQNLLQKREIQVNSLHHQGIKELAPGLQACAQASDGLIEAFSVPDKNFLLAVQWHPEYGAEWESSKKIFKAFIDAC